MKKRFRPVLALLDIFIVIFTIFLVIMIVVTVKVLNEPDYRYNPDNYTYTLQGGDYRSLANSFYLGSSEPVAEEKVTPELEPYAAVGGYYLHSFLLGIYETMPDEESAAAARQAMEDDRSRMGVYVPETDKIDKIFDTQ